MRYVLEDLLRVREFRETSAANEVQAKKALFDEALRTLKQTESELSEYHNWRLDKEEALYSEIKNQLITLKKLDDLKHTVALLRDREIALEKKVFDAENTKQAAKEELQKARDKYHIVVREKRKIEEHKGIWLGEAMKEQERALEKEMEEFKGLKTQFEETGYDS